MVRKQTWLHVSDGTNIIWVKIFHLYKGFSRQVSSESLFVKASARIVSPPKIEYKGFKRKNYFKGNVIKSLIVRTLKKTNRLDKSQLLYHKNQGIIVRLKNIPRSKYHYGSISRSLNRKRFNVLFKFIF